MTLHLLAHCYAAIAKHQCKYQPLDASCASREVIPPTKQLHSPLQRIKRLNGHQKAVVAIYHRLATAWCVDGEMARPITMASNTVHGVSCDTKAAHIHCYQQWRGERLTTGPGTRRCLHLLSYPVRPVQWSRAWSRSS